MTTIFDRIIAKEIPAHIVYEDERVIAFLDIKPINKGHILVVPKTPFKDIFDADEEALAHMIKTAAKIGRVLKETLPCNGINLIMNNGAAAGQEIFRAHLHVVPRFSGDGALLPPKHEEYGAGEMSALAERFAEALQSEGGA
jgi:histidine triad (HIT) family protein